VCAAIATGFAADQTPSTSSPAPARRSSDSRSVAIAALALLVIGMLERAGLKERARTVIS
jgi:uncharacterized membrane protein